MGILREIMGCHDLDKFWNLTGACLSEGLGTFFIVLIGCGSCVEGWEESAAPTLVHISLAFGFIVATVAHIFGHLSGGHVNPAVSIAMFFVGKIGFVRTCAYVASQVAGAILGALVLKAMTPAELRRSLGQTTVDGQLTIIQAFFVEFFLTFFLTLTICALGDENRPDKDRISPPCGVGFAVAAIHLFGIKYTGASVNPARAIGPCVVTKVWDHHWIYWLGPIGGAMLAAPLYQRVFSRVPDTVPDHSSSLDRSNEPGIEETTNSELFTAPELIGSHPLARSSRNNVRYIGIHGEYYTDYYKRNRNSWTEDTEKERPISVHSTLTDEMMSLLPLERIFDRPKSPRTGSLNPKITVDRHRSMPVLNQPRSTSLQIPIDRSLSRLGPSTSAAGSGIEHESKEEEHMV